MMPDRKTNSTLNMGTLTSSRRIKFESGPSKLTNKPSAWTCTSVCLALFILLLHTELASGENHARRCTEKAVQERAEMANVVVSGTVQKLMDDDLHSTNGNRLFKGQVEVKRIFKGEQMVDSLATIVPGRLREHKLVMVEGFGDPVICENEVHERDTKIFLLNPNGNGELKLNSSVMALTLHNLDYVDAVVKHIPFTTEKPQTVSPCYLRFCPFGATCRVNETTNKAMCVCEKKCSRVFAPVCGSDGATYTNLCMLDRASCVHSRLIRMVSTGVCGQRDPCEGHVCKFGAECMPSMDGKMARCQCPQHCPSYGDHVNSKPVCGNDGKDYANMCELRKAACYELKDIRIKYHGKCDPCQGFECEAPKVCHVGPAPERQPMCHCSIHCSQTVELVCGTDGRTYSNECLLRRQACKAQKDIQVFYRGKCSPENDPCNDVKCGPGAECTVDRSGIPSCICPPRCQPILRRVCGNDSVTYDNECELHRRSCEAEVYVVVKHQGPCGTDSACLNHYCPYGAICTEILGRPVCKCPQCTEEYAPVCGENGITYDNECKLRQENCQREENVRVKKQGACADGCGSLQCHYYAVCENSGGRERCVCPTSCVSVSAPVCGSDGVTYNNECELRVASCQQEKFLTIASKGTCDKCRGVTCDNHAKCEDGICVCPILCPTVREPVCGTDGRTYINECDMKKYSCARGITIEVQATGPCEGDSMEFSGSGDGEASGEDFGFGDDEDKETPTKKKDCTFDNCVKFGGTCERVGVETECTCKYNCEAVRQPVCGTDGRTYGNICMMKHQACIRREMIAEQDMDNCDEFDSEEPCDGSAPLVNPATGADYDCSPGNDMCPAHSYCHITVTFSKCCKEDKRPIMSCAETQFGCCSDGKTPANGPRGGGCPDMCKCNEVGSYGQTCDPQTKQCLCKPGVIGKRCDGCDMGYWGLNIVGRQNLGCMPCNCNMQGSERDDCDQMTGRCVCKPMVTGMKCDRCQDGTPLGHDGCKDTSGRTPPTSCDEVMCSYGSNCRLLNGHPVCLCEQECDLAVDGSAMVCGSNGQNFGSACQLELFACRLHQDITVQHLGPCKGAPPTAVTTSSPTTKPRKTTRHIDGSNFPDKDKTDKEKVNQPNDDDDDDDVDLLDEKCEIDGLCISKDCCPKNAECRNGLCSCMDGFIPSLDNKKCYVVEKPTKPVIDTTTTDPCKAQPDLCFRGKCVANGQFGFKCLCPLGYSGLRCEKESGFVTPSFGGVSYLTLPRISNASNDLYIEVVFKTMNNDGIILFNAKHLNGSGDFVSLAIVKGFVEFRYDLGGGPAILRSKDPVELNRSHRIIASRQREAGILVVNDEKQVTGSSPSNLYSLDLNDPLILGYIPNVSKEIYERVGTDLGLVGCITQLRAGDRDKPKTYNLELFNTFSDLLDGMDVNECALNPCSSQPCLNGATCNVLDGAQLFECRCKDGYRGILCDELTDPCASQPCRHGGKCILESSPQGFYCHCSGGWGGDRCDTPAVPKLSVPQFTGDSMLKIPFNESLASSMKIEVYFMAYKPSGVILFTTQNADGSGDFVALNLHNKKLVFTFSLGSGVGTIESKRHIHLDKWHRVSIMRTGRVGEMRIDDHQPITAEAPSVEPTSGSTNMLDITNKFIFLGGFKDTAPPAASGIEKGFEGAIQKVIINGRQVTKFWGFSMWNISQYRGPPCDPNPCMNGGLCMADLNMANCQCPDGYIGKRCEKKMDQMNIDLPVKFDGQTYLSYPNEVTHKQEHQQSNQFRIKFRTTAPDGILLLQTKGDSVGEDFLSLAVRDGRVVLSYNLGEGKNAEGNLHIVCSSSVDVTDGAWHTAVAERHQREGTLQVDDEDPVKGASVEGRTQLDTDGYLWVGGRSSLPWGLPVTKRFDGCIERVDVNGQQLHLVEDKNGRSTTLTFCTA